MKYRSSTSAHRALGGAVACLLTANGFALAVLVGGDAVTAAPVAASPAGAADRITLVTTRDGVRYVADRSTAEGRQAIENALRQGATVQDVATRRAPAGDKSIRRVLPDLLGSTSALSLDLDHLPTLPLNLPDAGGVVAGAATTVDKAVDDAQQAVDDATGKLPDTSVTPVVNQAKDQVNATVDQVQGTVSSTVGGAQQTVGQVTGGTPAPAVPSAPPTPAPVMPPAPAPIAPPVVPPVVVPPVVPPVVGGLLPH